MKTNPNVGVLVTPTAQPAANHGLVLAQRIYKADAILCDVCAAAATSEYQSKTAIQGWTSPRSALMNPFYIASNAVNRAKHKKNLRDS